jgi:ketosteroid isomerase-like protein
VVGLGFCFGNGLFAAETMAAPSKSRSYHRWVGRKTMQKAITALFVIGAILSSLTSCKPKDEITQDELVRRTQELFDAVASGNRNPWTKYFAEDCMYFDEKGRNMNKAALVADIVALPAGYSGSIKIEKAQSHIEGELAILSYDMDEQETVYGQNMTARYHATDTWMRRDGNWQIVAGQVLRYYEDPAQGKMETRTLPDYLGTYELAPGNTLTVSLDGMRLYRQRGDRPKDLLLPEAPDIFFRKGVEGRILFRRTNKGNVEALIDRRNNEDVVWKKTR